jgi:hypothetical protein
MGTLHYLMFVNTFFTFIFRWEVGFITISNEGGSLTFDWVLMISKSLNSKLYY